ncbi:MAG: methyltransferase domain-containing protein [Gammaproteobacteria bacterium]
MHISTAEQAQASAKPACRFCHAELTHTVVDLGMSPLCESYLPPEQLNHMEPFYPLHVHVCGRCFLVQLDEYVAPDGIFSEYAYFSSYSDSWVEHARQYTEQVSARFGLDASSKVMEVASNDGYLLQHFVKRGVPVLGIEPAANVARVAIEKHGVPTIVRFLGQQSAHEIRAAHGQADLLVGNNVLAHVPALNDFVAGLKILLKPDGVLTMEFPHLARLMEFNQYDTIYHEHFSYLSLIAVEKVFAAHGLALFDVEELPTHGGSLRIYARHTDDIAKGVGERVHALRQWEIGRGLNTLEAYSHFEQQVRNSKHQLLKFLIDAKRAGKSIVGYGTPGKGNTLLNYCSIRQDFLDYTVDRNPYKHGKFTPGTHIPIHAPERIRKTKPDYLLILPWNLKEEMMAQAAYIREWGGQFVVPIPEVRVYS